MTFDTSKIKGPKWLKQAFSDVDAKIEANKPISGIGTQVFDSAGGRPINSVGRGVGASAGGYFPFQVIAAGQNLGISPASSLFKNLKGETIPITGLLADETNMSDPGWFACPAIGKKIWLQIGTCASSVAAPRPLALTAATTQIRSGAVGSTLWDEYPDPISINSDDPTKPFQEFYNLLIAEITDPEVDPRPSSLVVTVGEERRQITQCWCRDILAVTWLVNGALCFVPVDPSPDYKPTA